MISRVSALVLVSIPLFTKMNRELRSKIADDEEAAGPAGASFGKRGFSCSSVDLPKNSGIQYLKG